MEKVKIKKKETYIQSSNGCNMLHVVVWEPQCEIRGILQISHGMVEEIDRYDEFARYVAGYGYVVAGNDHLGHGLSVRSPEEYGYINAFAGSRAMVADLHRVTICLKKAYGRVPFFLLGHSMGSFLGRRYIEDYGYTKVEGRRGAERNIDGFICMGTGSRSRAELAVGKLIATIESKRYGDKYRSPLLKKLAFLGYNFGVPKKIIYHEGDTWYMRRRTANDWLNRDTREVDKYNDNPRCGFDYTVKGYQVLFDTIEYCQAPENIERIPMELPILMVAGDRDPNGRMGRDIKKVYEEYLEYVSSDVEMILYEGARHEILLETSKKETFDDIVCWLISHTRYY